MAITLAEARKNAGLSIQKAARALRVDQETLREWESGRQPMRIPSLMRMCNLYQVSVDGIILP